MTKDQAMRVAIEPKRARAPRRDLRRMVLTEAERWPEKMPREIAKALSISVWAVVAAGSYWQEKGVVTIDDFGRMLRRSRS